jgi:alkanesulfonate monooxygenase SsuD/methylene tetrahydromethanopterin reductase-like flavin-dependent oxidoreductase (luciferase family)
VRAHRLWPGVLSILLLSCLGLGLVSAALPDDADDYGYYDGDGDDAVAAPERLAVLVDLVVSARGETTPIRTSEAFEGPAVSVARPIVLESPPPLLRSPPAA